MKQLTKKLIVAISAICFISILVVGLMFAINYRRLSLNNAEEELIQKSGELANFGRPLILDEYDPLARNNLVASVNELTDSELWIFNIEGKLVAATASFDDIQGISLKILKDINSINEEYKISYDYSEFMGRNTLSVMTFIKDDDGHNIGAIFLHKDVDGIFKTYIGFSNLLMISLVVSLMLSIFLGIIYSYKFTKPIEKLTNVAKEIGNGNYKVSSGIVQDDEIGVLATTIDVMAIKINDNIENIKNLEKQAKDLVANVSHEFKTPLTLIRGYTENMLDGTIESTEEVYEKVLVQTNILNKLVNDLLDLSKLQSGTINFDFEDLSMNSLVIDVVNDMNVIAKEKNIEIKYKNPKDNIIITGDYIRLRQVLTIILDNAIKYSNNDKIIIINLTKDKISIKDQGIGMKKETINKIYTRFYQNKNGSKGYGLGLAIAKHIIDNHNYNIDINSKLNKGTEVIIRWNKDN